MSRLWMLLQAPGAGRRGRGLTVLALAVLVPVLLLLTLVPARSDEAVPAAVVNLDVPVQQSGKTPIAAGKLLTEHLATTSSGVQWSLTDAETARAGLESGRFLAVLTIPADFSANAATLASADPTRSTLQVQATAAHGYLSGVIAENLATALPQGVATQLTSGFVDGSLAAFAQLRQGIDQAATGAGQISTATEQAAGGAEQLADATRELSAGVAELGGVLDRLPAGAHELGAMTAAGAVASAEVAAAVLGGSARAEELVLEQDAALVVLDAVIARAKSDPELPLREVLAELEALRVAGGSVAAGLSTQRDALAGEALEAGAVAVGAGTIAALSDPVAHGLGELAAATERMGGAVDQLAGGDDQLASGLTQLASGSAQLGDALAEARDSIPDYTSEQQQSIASVAAAPIAVDDTTLAGPSSARLSVLAAVAPIALWLGALVTFFALAPFSRAALPTPTSSWRLAFDGGATAVVLAAVQGLSVWAVVVVVGAAPGRLAVGLALVLIMSVCFALVHQALVAAFGRAGLIVSAVLLGLQLAAAGTVAPPTLSPAADTPLRLLPLSIALQAGQALVGGSLHAVLSGAVGLAVWAVLAVLVTVVAVARARRRAGAELAALPA